MGRYRKRPVVVEATQFHKSEHWDGKHVTLDGVQSRMTPGGREFFIRTLEGDHIVREDDWVITGIAGEHYPCKPDIFKATYEAVSE